MDKLEGLILRYWRLTERRWIESFPFEKAFALFREAMYPKLATHGMLGLQAYIDNVSQYYDLSVLDSFVYTSFHTGYKDDLESIKRRIFEPRYENFHNRYQNDPIYSKILEIYNELGNSPSDIEGKILLMERAISCAHRDGLFIDIESLRKQHIHLSVDPVFNIYTRIALEVELRSLTKSFYSIFIDFNDVHEMNSIYGYETTNTYIREKISLINRPNLLMGRWFSGDEILIVSASQFSPIYLSSIETLSVLQPASFKYFILPICSDFYMLQKTISSYVKSKS